MVKTFEKLLLNMAFADLFVAIASTVHLVSSKVTTNLEHTILAVYLAILAFTTSIVCVFMISFERFIAVKYPLKHLAWSTPKKMNTMIAISWLSCFLFTMVLYLYNKETGFLVLDFKGFATHYKLPIGIFNLLGCVLLIAVYSYIITATLQKHNTMKLSNGANDMALRAWQAREKAVLVTCALVVLSFVVCIIPFAIAAIAFNTYIGAFSLLLFVNSAFNPLVYFFRSYIERYLRSRDT